MAVAFPAQAIVRRELLSGLRRARYFYLLVLFLGVVGLAIAMTWPDDRAGQWNFGYQIQALAMSLTWIMFGSFVFLAPAMAGSTIVSERERDTLDLLRLSLIAPRAFVMGKLISVMGVMMLFVVAVLPVFGIMLTGLGIDTGQMMQVLGILFLSTLVMSLWALACSAFFRRTFVALVVSYAGVVALNAAPVLASEIVREGIFGYNRVFWEAEPFISSFSPAALLLMPLESSGRSSNALPIWLGVGGQVLLCLMLYGIAVWAMRRKTPPVVVDTRQPIDDVAILEARRKRFPYYLIDPLKRKEAIEDHRNPMLVREMRWGFVANGPVTIRIFYVATAIFLISALDSVMDIRSGAAPRHLAMFYMGVIAFASPVMIATSLTKEYAAGNMDMIRMTLQSPVRVLWGKTVAALMTIAPLLVAAALSLVLVGAFRRDEWLTIAAGIAYLVLSAGLSVSLGLAASVSTRTANAALSAAYGLTFMVFLGASLVPLGFLDAVSYVNTETGMRLSFLSPIVAFGCGKCGAIYRLANWLTFATLAAVTYGLCVWVFVRRHWRQGIA